ncbi:hypothetical protein EDB92DRAFT_706213 [Lactarius akahatsu]|uniref:Uncharacterized protein n=1 Tax=Lactarius akahatsu TaxID=416441 RepID=A0AAD4LGR8_9AGAM|nr:hypothetical protein EDB92DRAFT_706213 [Lactarius akahatsu]
MRYVLEAACDLNVQDTSPELQREFCILWNQIFLKVQNDNNGWMAAYILKPIRNVYVALHQDTEAAPTRFFGTTGSQDDVLRQPSSYPFCNIPGHHPDSTPRIHDYYTSTTFAHIATPASIASPDASSSSVPAPFHVVNTPMDVPPLINVYAPGSSPRPSDIYRKPQHSCCPARSSHRCQFRYNDVPSHSRNLDIRPSFRYLFTRCRYLPAQSKPPDAFRCTNPRNIRRGGKSKCATQ